MSRKDYIALAAVIKSNLDSAKSAEAKDALGRVAVGIAAILSAGNSLFDTERFYAACGVK